MKILGRLWFFLLLVLVFSACKDDIDEDPPVIVMERPTENQFLQLPDTLLVRGSISDEKALCQVSVILVDESLQPAASSHRQTIQGTSYQLAISYPVTDLQLEDGTYYLKVTAFDGTNETKSFVKLSIGGVPKVLQSLLYLTQPSPNALNVYRWLTGTPELMNTLSGDYKASAVSSRHQFLAVVGRQTGPLNAINYPNGNINWNVPVVNAGFPNFTHLDLYEDITYLGRSSGQVEGYNFEGTQVFASITEASWTPVNFILHENVLIVQQEAVTGTDRQIAWYFSFSGNVERDEKQIDFDVVRFFSHETNEVLMFCNKNGEGQIKTLFQSTSGIAHERTLPGGEINEVVQVNASTYLIAHESAVYQYRHGVAGGLVTLLSGKNAQTLVYEALNGHMYLAIGSEIESYTYTPGSGNVSASASLNAGDVVTALHPIYNK